MEPHQPRLNIVLFEPQIPQNTGNIARTCACTGARLHLVGPMGFSIDDKKLKRAGLSYPDNCYLIFGREDAGIDEHILLRHPDSCLRLPMIGPVRSLNLSNTVAIAVYETLRQWGFPALQNEGQLHQFCWDDPISFD